MKPEQLNAIETNLGFLIETPKLVVLFGGVKANLVNLQASFPQYEFVRVKQTHGDVVVKSDSLAMDYQVEADAHFTLKKNFGLCIATADCIPLFIYDSVREVIAGVHAGWRGVANRIVPKTISRLIQDGSSAENLQIFLGPHIQQKSFEVSIPVRDELLQSAQGTSEVGIVQALNEEKSLVDLNRIMRLQLQHSGVPLDHVFDLHLDTFSDLRFHSHRRDKEKAGRQLSFICRK